MKQLHIPYCEKLDFSVLAEAEIEVFGWKKNNYTPRTIFQLCWNRDALAIAGRAYESELRAVEENDGGEVWADSCMEFFFGLEDAEHRYINLEVNPLGAIVMGYGSRKTDRTGLEKEYKAFLKLSTKVQSEAGLWRIRYEIPFSVLNQIFGRDAGVSIQEFRGNFFKCGEKTSNPHYGMWSKVNGVEPDFHKPEFFGRLVLVE